MKTLYLHIGHYKTGTSAFQSYCADNAAGLARRGLLYPKAGRGVSAPTSHAGLAIPLAAEHGFHPPRWFGTGVSTDEAFGALHAELGSTRQRKALISSEEVVQLALCEDPDSALAALRRRLEPYSVKVIFTVREPLALLTSWYAQVSRGATPRGTFLDFAATMNPDFLSQDPIRARFARTFGAGHVRLLRYAGQGPWLKRRMLWSTRTVPFSRAHPPIANVTPGLDTLEVERLGKLPPDTAAFTVTRATLETLQTQIDRINAGYAELSRHLTTDPSALSLVALARHYHELIAPAADRMPVDPGEAAAMRDLAQDAGDGALRDTLLRIAGHIERSQTAAPQRGIA